MFNDIIKFVKGLYNDADSIPLHVPVFYGNERKYLNECINKESRNIIKACIPKHTFGHPCRIDEIVEICDRYHIEVVEDAAESLGSFYKSRHTGVLLEKLEFSVIMEIRSSQPVAAG